MKTPRTCREAYNIYDLYLLSLFTDSQGDPSRNQVGIIGDFRASDYLLEKLGCADPRVGKYNVLRLYHPELEFERVFVFYDSVQNNHYVSAK